MTDIAKSIDGDSIAADIIKNWIRNRGTIEFIGTWEQLHNPNFKVVEFDHFKMNAGLTSFVLSPGKWVEKTGATVFVKVVVRFIHTVFKVKNEKELIPEYLQMFFKRKEIDRYARFNSWGSAREAFNWDDMCNIKLPIPELKIQEAIVTIYHALETRKRINEQLKSSIKPLCPVLMRGVVEEMESEVIA
ncbi:MAG: hypothetical protein HOA38_03905 [Candidatus Marinimicrobia bacterium]|nr:hypothetical protein [Candidatus Neomarinimicrobiota bacterium]